MKTRVLIIEDNAQNLYLATYLLRSAGCEVFQSRDGRKGIELASRMPLDLILVDIQLPILDGYQVTRALRRDLGLKEIPIVAVTSYAMPGDREKALAAGCTGYIEKPINPDTFIAEVRRHLSPRRPSEGRKNE